MLHRSFKPAKCKTSLKLATSRMKLMKNKKGVQLNQMKRELAQLLESGQDQTARIRVEHVIREEKMMGAYELIELYCELIAARLPIIESQKICPIDLKEAITSVVFASLRCSDIPELLDIRKHLTAKYGKEFITAALEMRPNCGVSRMLVEKLSAVPPDGPTKIKVLNAIAEEHNIIWEPKAFGEKDPKPPEDLLNGPSTFEKASKIFEEPPKFQAPPSEDQKHGETLNFSEQNMRSSLGSQGFASTDIGRIKTSTTSHSDVRHSDMESERMDARQSYPRDGNTSSFSGKNWNMEFKDATSAAQAAAESAERASMAARAAAELSNQDRINRQYSSESQRSNIHSLRDERPGNSAASNFTGQHPDAVNQFPRDRNANSTRQSFSESQQSNIRGSRDEIPGNYAASNLTGQHSDAVNHSSHHRNAKITRQSSSESQQSNIRGSRDERSGNYAASNLTDQHPGAMNHSYHDRNAKIISQSSSESHKSNVHGLRDERPGQYAASKLTGRRPANNSFHDRNPNLQNEPIDENEYDNMGRTKSSSRSASLRSNKALIDDDDTLVNITQKEERYSRKGSFEEDVIEAERGPFTKLSMKKQLRDSNVESMSGREDENLDYFGEGKIKKQFSTSSSHSHSSTSSDKYNVLNSNHLKFGNDAVEDPFIRIEEGNIHREAIKTNISDDDAVAFDESSSDGDVSRFDIGPEYDEVVSASFFPSPDRNPPTHPLPNTDAGNPRRNMSNSPEISTTQTRFPSEWLAPLEISESSTKSVDPSVNFDDLDGPKFDSEDEVEKSMPIERKGSSILPRKQNVFAINPEPTQGESHELTGSDKRPWLDSMEVHTKNNRGTEDLGESSLYNPVDKENHIQPSRVSLVHEVRDTPESPDLESGKELNFGMLTGGLRHKGYKLRMYPKSPSDDASSSLKKSDNESPSPVEQTSPPTVRSSFSSRVGRNVDETPRSGGPTTHSDSDSDSSGEELAIKKAQGNKKPSLRIPVTYFGSDSDESEEDRPKQTVTNRGRLGSGVSRRTKASPSNSETKSSYSRHRVGSVSSIDSNSSVGQSTIRPQTGGLSQRGNREQKPSLEKRVDSKPMPKPEIPSREGSLKGPTEEQPSSPPRKIASASNSTENPKNSSLSSTGETSTGDKSAKNAAHVHPKLPEYDKVFAHFQAMRSDRK